MKALHVIPPIAALLASGIWIGTQRRSVATLRHETVVLRERVAAAKADAAGRPNEPADAPGGGKVSAKDVESMSWEEVAAAFEQASTSTMPDMRLMMALQRRLMAMSADELLAALDEVEALGLTPHAQMQITGAVMDLLGHKAPEALLERYAERLGTPEAEPLSWRLSNAFQHFVAKDSAAAEAWLDRQIAAGHFVSRSLDGTQSMRSMFEGRLISNLVGSDPAGAARRLREMPEVQRAEALQHGIPAPLRDEHVGPFMELARDFAPDDKLKPALDHLVSRLSRDGDLARIENLVAGMESRPGDADALAAAAARQQLQRENSTERLESMREWMGEHAPAEVDRFTGETLGNYGPRSFEQASELALKYHEDSGSDEVLAGFLRGQMARHNLPKAQELLDHIGDETLREQLREELEKHGP